MTISPSLDERFRAAAAAANLLGNPHDLRAINQELVYHEQRDVS